MARVGGRPRWIQRGARVSVGAARQSGTAIALVMWLLSVMTITVAGVVSLSRDDVSLAEAQLTTAKAYYLGKGVARLVMRDRVLSAQSGDASAEQGALSSRVFSRRYTLGGAQIDARVLPASGFVSLLGSDDETWITLLTKVGGLDTSAARQFLGGLSEQDLIQGGGAPTNLTGFGAYKYLYGGGRGGVPQIESLLAVQGMTRDAYERIRRSIAPFSGPPRPDLSFAPAEIRAAFNESPSNHLGDDARSQSGSFCVEVRMSFGEGNRLEQRIWVVAQDATNDALNLVKVERPVRVAAKSVG